jgi:hypothetical protein
MSPKTVLHRLWIFVHREIVGLAQRQPDERHDRGRLRRYAALVSNRIYHRCFRAIRRFEGIFRTVERAQKSHLAGRRIQTSAIGGRSVRVPVPSL